MRIVVLDTETTGLSETDQVVELALVTLEEDKQGRWESVTPTGWSSLIKPTCPVSLQARAVHHITDTELAKAQSVMDVLLRTPVTWGDSGIVIAAHNLAFDRVMLEQSLVAHGLQRYWLPLSGICTWRCAMHLYPDAPAFSNQVLRYYLNVDVPPVDGPPHRALPDAVVTAQILLHMLRQKTVDELIDLTKMQVLLKTVSFGKHRGTLYQDLDEGMLRFILRPDKTFPVDVVYTARHWLDRRYCREKQ